MIFIIISQKSEKDGATALLAFVYLPGNVLASQDPAVQVLSALEGLTVVFGMGTGVSPPPRLLQLAWQISKEQLNKSLRNADFRVFYSYIVCYANDMLLCVSGDVVWSK